jgi:hypothetical protein
MKVRDKTLKVFVDVPRKECPTYVCYWPRLNPGSFCQGRGYRSYGDARDKEWLCGRREINGCPITPGVKGEEAV